MLLLFLDVRMFEVLMLLLWSFYSIILVEDELSSGREELVKLHVVWDHLLFEGIDGNIPTSVVVDKLSYRVLSVDDWSFVSPCFA